MSLTEFNGSLNTVIGNLTVTISGMREDCAYAAGNVASLNSAITGAATNLANTSYSGVVFPDVTYTFAAAQVTCNNAGVNVGIEGL